jgi:hypothetical protein
MRQPDDNAGPTAERLAHAIDGEGKDAVKFWDLVGRAKSNRKFTMRDDALGRVWMRQKISGEEYSALKRFALHWLAGGLQGPMQSVDLNRIFAFDPGSMSGLAKTERQADHRDAWHTARLAIGFRPSFVATQVACYDSGLREVGMMLGYKSEARGREKANELLCDAGYRLAIFWKERDR